MAPAMPPAPALPTEFTAPLAIHSALERRQVIVLRCRKETMESFFDIRVVFGGSQQLLVERGVCALGFDTLLTSGLDRLGRRDLSEPPIKRNRDVVAIKEAIPNAKVKKGEVKRAVIVRTKINWSIRWFLYSL